MQGSINSDGNVAKWAPLYGFLFTVQTDLLFFVVFPFATPEYDLAPFSLVGSLIASLS